MPTSLADLKKKIKYKQLKELSLSLIIEPLEKQKEILNTTIENWKQGCEQVDDILVMGMRV